MATKKAAPKKEAKAATPMKKTAAKQAASQKPVKATGSIKSEAKKPVKKAAPAKRSVAAVKVAKPAASSIKDKKVATRNGAHSVGAHSVKKGTAVGKTAAPVKKSPAVAQHEPAKPPVTVKKASVEAPTVQEVKPAIKPLEKPASRKESVKPVSVPKTTTSKAVKYEPEFTKSVLDYNNQNQEQQKPTMRYSDAELAEFRELINRKLETAKKELAYLQGLITRKDESGEMDEGRYMTMEDGSMSMEREQLSQMASRQIQFIDHLEKAIMRIENKTYGVCRVTGKLIDKARLRAVPHATLSIEAKQMMNK
ncbi:TraR/DksA C4-type zinc finger protein [Chitinophagaceae bacterium LB-8]|uniref:TraR/DksA C4-type zinc finger protein n=1 Tax=Paraflavisolibacter caeni TaxID=2982496 RepID=A0A9X2XSW5_9BACT|nr:TraR/DksA C4-type zinc finger protein [Paraflavisolibacter caeni]MCU7547666.1 TraR/DksA C4-type zinc finger protein [Paraflavisolibacter caeni]